MTHFMRDATIGYLVSRQQQQQLPSAPPGRSATELPSAPPVRSLTMEEIRDAEVGVFNAAIQYASRAGIPCSWSNPRFRMIYDNKARSVVSNLDPGSYVRNEQALDNVKRGAILPHEVSTLPHSEVFPDRWSSVMEIKKQHDVYLSTAHPIAMTDQYKCKRCKRRECSFIELQTRSCDEPATLFIQCVQCGNTWRIG